MFSLAMFAVPFSVAFVGGINAMNMIDGADGMAGKMALITVLGRGGDSVFIGAFELLPLILAIAGALVDFCCSIRVFLSGAPGVHGRCGKYVAGLMLGWFMAQVAGNAVSAEPAVVLWLFGVPLLDTLTVMIRRAAQNFAFEADRTHIHHVWKTPD